MARVLPRICAALVLATLHGEVAAQVAPDSSAVDRVPAAEPTPPPTGGWGAYGVMSHSWSTVAALTVVLPAGGAQDPEDRGGTAWLLGNTVRDAVVQRLEGSTAEVTVRVGRGHTVYQVLTSPDDWEPAYDALEDALFEGTLDPRDLDRDRVSLQAVMAFEAGAPVREFELEAYRALGGQASSWSRDPRGTSASLTNVTAADLATYRSRHYAREGAVFTIAGAADADQVARAVTGQPRASASGRPFFGVAEPRSAPDGPAWIEGERIRLVRDVTSGWISAAFPVDPATPRTPVEFIVHRVRSELMTDPPAPGLFSMEIELQPLPTGDDALVVRAAVLPDALGSWERRILETTARMAGELLEPGFLQFHRRTFRNVRLVEDATPEAEGLRGALDLLRDGRIRDLPTEIRSLDGASVQQAGASLGPPRVLVLGPDLAGGAGSPRP